MKRIGLFVLLCTCIMLMAAPAWATNGYQLVGVGQLSTSMAGAVTAAPQDAMTAITNPAGVARIGSRADFSMTAFMPKRSVNFSANRGESTEGGSDMYGIPAIGWAAPAFNRNDMYFGGGMYGTSGLGVDYDQIVMMPGMGLDMMASAPAGTFSDVTFNGYSSIQFWKMAPTVAWNVNKDLSLGFALNLDYQSVTISQKFRNVPFWNNPMNKSLGMTQKDINFDLGRPTSQMGFGFTLGTLYTLNESLTLGFMYSSKQSFDDSEFRVGTNDILNYSGATGKAGTYKMDLDYPQQAALGIAFTPAAMDKKLTVTADLKWINWSDTHDKVDFTGPTGSFMTMSGPTSGTTLNFGWEDQTVYALGVRYSATKDLSVSAGYNFAEAPIDEADVFNNLVFPAIVEQHFTVGFDYMLGDHWGIAMAYEKGIGEELTGAGDVSPDMQAVTPFQANSGAKVELETDAIGMQITYKF